MDSILVASRRETIAAIITSLFVATLVIYRLYFHPLRHVPGPVLARISSLFLYCICYLGIEGRTMRYYHQKYQTKVLCIAPNAVSVSARDAVTDIYVTRGGFPKDPRYQNFNLGPFVTIFSAIDTEYRDTRAKAVAPLFAAVRLRAASHIHEVIGSCVADFVAQMSAFKASTAQVDILDLCSRLSIDVVTGYLLGQQYGGLKEHGDLSYQERQKKKLSANPFVYAIVAFSRFSLLPNWLFRLTYTASSWLSASDKVKSSFLQLDQFTERVMDQAMDSKFRSTHADNTYQGRLVQAGISPAEAAAQSKAIVFAGADSTAVILTTIVFHLVQNTDARRHLLDEIRSSKGQDAKAPRTDAQTLPYLRAVVKEGLRLGMANPTRLTRVVPQTGLQVGDVCVPPGTVVGCAAFVLHHDPDIFPRPFNFRPERWLEDGPEENLRRAKMEKSMLPFGAGLRGCIGKNLALYQLHETVMALVDSEVLEGAQTCQQNIEVVEWFNGEIKDHILEIEWPSKRIRTSHRKSVWFEVPEST